MDSTNVVKATKIQQLTLLLYKQTLLFRRHKALSAVKLLSPIIMMIVYIIAYRSTIKNTTNFTTYGPEPLFMDYSTKSDHVIGYSFTYSDNKMNYNQIIQNVGNFLGLEVGKDIVPSVLTNSTVFLSKVGKAKQTTYFCNIFFTQLNDTSIGYEMVYNYEDQSYPNSMLFLQNSWNLDIDSDELRYAYSIQIAVENAIVKYYAGSEASIEVQTRKPPTLIESTSGISSTQILEGFLNIFIYIGYTLPFIIFLQQIVDEKERKIRSFFRTFGVYDEIYLLSWLIEGIILTVYTTTVILIFGYSSKDIGMNVFQFTNSSIIFSLLISYGIALYSSAILLSSFMKTSKGAVILGVVLFLFGLLYSIFASMFGGLMYYIWYPKPYFITILIDIIPTSNFIKIFTDIANVVNPNLLLEIISTGSSSGKEQPHYYWSTMMKSLMTKENDFVGLPSAYESLNILFFLGLFYLFLAWYLDKVVPSEFGGRKPILFLFTSDYWFPNDHKKSFNESDLIGRDRHHDPDIQAENFNVTPENQKSFSLIIRNLYKSYGHVMAVNGLNLSAEKGKIVALLGHNGCGKTTTMNMITGNTTIDSGKAVLHGYDVCDQMKQIHTNIGVCPQFDVYWPYFSAREHLYILTLCKEQRPHIERDIDDILKSVKLDTVGGDELGTYSGGMRRRLSVALAMIGNPQVILLDECTTGVDPSTRRQLWKLIKSNKKDKLILLTTHSMEEAEALGDKIAIMNKGKLASIGTTIHLKEKYSTGYKLNLVTTNVEQCRQLVQTNIRSAVFDKVNSNNLCYNITNLDDLNGFLKFLTTDPHSQELVTDWQIQNTSLEDVFLRVVHSS